MSRFHAVLAALLTDNDAIDPARAAALDAHYAADARYRTAAMGVRLRREALSKAISRHGYGARSDDAATALREAERGLARAKAALERAPYPMPA